jgi:hypothetical protein
MLLESAKKYLENAGYSVIMEKSKYDGIKDSTPVVKELIETLKSSGLKADLDKAADLEAKLALKDYLDSKGISQDDWEQENDLELFKEDGEKGIIYTREALENVLENKYNDFIECLENSVSCSKVVLL